MTLDVRIGFCLALLLFPVVLSHGVTAFSNTSIICFRLQIIRVRLSEEPNTSACAVRCSEEFRGLYTSESSLVSLGNFVCSRARLYARELITPS